MFESLKCCAEGLQLAVSDHLSEGFWIATGGDSNEVVAAGKLTVIDIPKEAKILHLNIEDFEKVKKEYERTT